MNNVSKNEQLSSMISCISLISSSFLSLYIYIYTAILHIPTGKSFATVMPFK